MHPVRSVTDTLVALTVDPVAAVLVACLAAVYIAVYLWLGIEAFVEHYGEQNGPVDPDPYWRQQR